MAPFTPAQKLQLAARGIGEDEARRQLALLVAPPPFLELDRPCRIGDGIERIDPARQEELILLHEQAARAGRCAKFVPASGAASRMFHGLVTGEDVPRFVEGLDRFAFVDDLRAELAFRGYDLDVLRTAGSTEEIVQALLGADGLDYAAMPKGLIPFHRYGDATRTPIEEHLAEAAATIADEDHICRVHATVSPEHLHAFRLLAERVVAARGAAAGATFRLEWSTQKSSTDTIAGAPGGTPFLGEAGELLFRPAGHGALLANLAEVDAEIVFVKNIDNVQPDGRRGATVRWKKILGGRFLTIQRATHLHVARLRGTTIAEELEDEASAFARATFGIEARGKELLLALDRPLRVCGVVVNTGEPGGGPFWVRDREGKVQRQIVEGAQVDPASEAQRELFRSGTHFNPVDLVCGLRDPAGVPYDLKRFVDPQTSIVARKTHAGRELLALERPGLWNGAMAGWLTAFVEVPIETFTPVKTVMDLLREEHQP